LTDKKRNIFLSGVVVLTLSNVLVKAIGVMFKIPLVNTIGDEGMGYFNSAYTIYTLFYMISTAGLPIAVSILISESMARGNLRQAKKTFRVTLGLFLIIGLLGMSVMLFFSKLFAKAIGNTPAYICIVAIAPTLFFICVSSALRGYFQGHQNMFPTAISQIIEAAGKLICGILLAVYAINRGFPLYKVAAFAVLGLSISTTISALYLVITKTFFRPEKYLTTDINDSLSVDSNRRIIKSLFKIAIPITISASLMSFTSLIDVAMIMRRLQSIGYTEAEANSLYGNYTSLVVPMFNMPPVLVYPIAYSIVPFISAAMARGDKEKASKAVSLSIKAAALISLPCAFGLSALSKPILSLLFTDESSVEKAWPLLSVLAIAVFFVGILAVTNAILQSLHKENLPIISILAGAVVKIISGYILIGRMGIMGTPVSTLLCYIVIAIINFIFVVRATNTVPIFIKSFIKPLVASASCTVAALIVFINLSKHMPEKLSVLFAIGVAAVVYLIMILLLKAIDREELYMLPKGEKLSKILFKLRLVK